jgi:gll3079 protein
MATDLALYIPSIEISCFKSLKHLKIDSFGSINLLTGDNNVGKSTLLEALFVYVSEGNSDVLLRIAGERMNCFGARLEYDDEYTKKIFAFFFTDWKLAFGNSIFITSGTGKSLQIDFVYYYETEVQDEGETYLRRKLIDAEQKPNDVSDIEKFEAIRVKYEGEEQLISFDRARVRLRKSQSDMKNIQFIRTSSYSDEVNARLWDKIALTDLEVEVINALRIIEPDIKGIAFLEEPVKSSLQLSGRRRAAYITYCGKEGRFPLSVMGDGMNRILSLILGLVNCKDGVCFIDEIENGVYYRRQPALWKIISHLVEKLHIQLFATTHSNDCVKSFAESVRGITAKLIRLERREKGLKAVDYTAEEVSIAANNDIEVR